jgi:Flp pilus assembly protein TadD
MNRHERRAARKQGRSVADATRPPIESLLAEALHHHRAGRLDHADQLYRRILAARPAHPQALANMGMLHHQRRALPEAEAWYAKALAVQRTPGLLSNLAVLQREQGDLPGAERLLCEALELRPDFPDALYNLGVTQIEAGRPGEAVAPLLKRAHDPDAGADVHANLARALDAVGETEGARQHGRQALLLKDQRARTDFQAGGGQPVPSVPAPPFDPTRPQCNVVAFSLWGARATYVDGMITNAGLVRALYPGWTCRVYLNNSVPQPAVEKLRQAGAQIVAMPATDSHYGLFWRFFAADDAQVQYFLCRDADSRVNTQEAAAVTEWLGSGRPFHVMRDATFHTELMLAGLWGGVGGRLRGIRGWIDRFYRPTYHRWADQDFLRAEIWPRIREQTMIHDGVYDLFGARSFPVAGRLTAPDHVGAGFRLPE